MKILRIDSYIDGGTIEITTDEGVYCIDNRLFSNLKGKIFFNYPKDDNRNIVPNQNEIKAELINALAEYTVSEDEKILQPSVDEILLKLDGFETDMTVSPYNLPYTVPEEVYKESICGGNFSLKELTGLDICTHSNLETVRFIRLFEDGRLKGISFTIPYYNKYHPEKMVATSFGMFGNVLEYTKEKSYSSQEIDWHRSKIKFNECLIKICRLRLTNKNKLW